MTDDLRFVYNDDSPPWRSGGKQYLQGTDCITLEPKHNLLAERPLSLKWNRQSRLPLLFYWNSRFIVEGEFQTRDGKVMPGKAVLLQNQIMLWLFPAGGTAWLDKLN